MILSKATTEDEYYFFDLCGFGKRDEETGGWKFEQAAHPLVVPGKSSVSNVFWYVWRPWTRPSFRLTEGTWKVELVGITSEMTKPKGSKIRKVYFPQELVKVLEERRESNNPMSKIWAFSDEIEENQVLSRNQLVDMKTNLKRFGEETIQQYRSRIRPDA